MNIGFLTFTFHGSGGSSLYAKSFVKSLSRNEKVDKITVLTIGKKSQALIDFFDNNKIFNVHCNFPSHLKRYEFGLRSINFVDVLKNENIDIVHAEHSFEGILASLYKKKYDAPFVYVREVVSKFLPNIYSRHILFNIEKFLTENLNYDALVSWSKYMVENFFSKWNIDLNKVRVIPGGVDLKKFNPKIKFKNIRSDYGIEDDETLFLSIKIFSSSNTFGLINAIKAFEKFSRHNKNAKFLIGGDGKGRVILEKIIDKLDLNNKVILAGRINPENLINFYRSADATVHFFMYDASISVSMMESLACGTPILTTNVGEVPNLVNSKVGFLVNQDIGEMSKAMDLLHNNKKTREKMGRNAFNLAKEKFDIDLITRKYVELYEELLS